jgi:hypothetical protein
MRNMHKILTAKPEGKKPFGRPKFKWEGNTEKDLRETGFGVWVGFIWLNTEASGGNFCIHRFHKVRQFLDQLRVLSALQELCFSELLSYGCEA